MARVPNLVTSPLTSPLSIFIRLGNRICSKIEYEQQNDPWNVERFLEDLLLVVKGQSNLDIDGYL